MDKPIAVAVAFVMVSQPSGPVMDGASAAKPCLHTGSPTVSRTCNTIHCSLCLPAHADHYVVRYSSRKGQTGGADARKCRAPPER